MNKKIRNPMIPISRELVLPNLTNAKPRVPMRFSHWFSSDRLEIRWEDDSRGRSIFPSEFTRGWKLSLARVTAGSRSRLNGVKYLNRGREATETHARPPTTNETFRQFVKGNIYLFSTALISRVYSDRVLHTASILNNRGSGHY